MRLLTSDLKLESLGLCWRYSVISVARILAHVFPVYHADVERTARNRTH